MTPPTDASQTASARPASREPKPLSALRAGDHGVVFRIDEADHAMLIRLKTMGMHEGRAVRVVRGGSRIIVSCGGTRVGLSAEVAKHVRILLSQPTHGGGSTTP